MKTDRKTWSKFHVMIPPGERELLEDLKNRSRSASVGEAVRKAIAYYGTLLDMRDGGGRVVIEREGIREILVIV